MFYALGLTGLLVLIRELNCILISLLDSWIARPYHLSHDIRWRSRADSEYQYAKNEMEGNSDTSLRTNRGVNARQFKKPPAFRIYLKRKENCKSVLSYALGLSGLLVPTHEYKCILLFLLDSWIARLCHLSLDRDHELIVNTNWIWQEWDGRKFRQLSMNYSGRKCAAIQETARYLVFTKNEKK